MGKIRKISAVAILCAILVCFCFTGCKGKEAIYKTRFCFSLISAPYETDGSISGCLTEEEPYFEADVGMYPFHYTLFNRYIEVLRYEGENDPSPVTVLQIEDIYNEADGDSVYTVEKDGKTEEVNFSAYGFYDDNDRFGYNIELSPQAGIHRIRFMIPEIDRYYTNKEMNIEDERYRTKPVEFELVFNIAEDERRSDYEIEIENTENILYSSPSEETGSLDFYIMNRAEGIQFAIDDPQTGTRRSISGNEKNRTMSEGKSGLVATEITRSGMYWYRFEYGGDETFAPKFYEFYVLFID